MTGKAVIILLACVAGTLALPRPMARSYPEKIVGGEDAIKGEAPYIVALRRPSHYCGGSILTSTWIITAAHCATGAPSTYTIRAGDHNNAVHEGTEQDRQVVEIIRHPQYNQGTQYANDIAMMRVDSPFVFDEWVQPVQSAYSGLTPPNDIQCLGWGALSEGGSSPTILQKVMLPFVSDEDCRAAYGASLITDSMLCAGLGGKDACQGDSGGPLMCRVGGTNYLCGLVSWGYGCARPTHPGVNTEVSYFDDWISEIIARE